MPRFSSAFTRRKSTSTSEDFHNVQITGPDTGPSSFRVLERPDASSGKAFEGPGRFSRVSTTPLATAPRPETADDNLFANYSLANRGSGGSHTTKGTSTDNSSRHSNASTAPSSADMNGLNHPDDRRGSLKKSFTDFAGDGPRKSSTYGFLKGAGRTFSFGVQKKESVPPPGDQGIPDVPPVPPMKSSPSPYDENYSRSRGMTASTTSTATATPPKLEGGGMDMGGDFGSMFSTFDKRSSTATVLNMRDGSTPRSLTGNRVGGPAPIGIDNTASVSPPLGSYNSLNSNDNLLNVSRKHSPDRHTTERFQSFTRQTSEEDEDARLLRDSVAAGQILEESDSFAAKPSTRRWRPEQESFSVVHRKPVVLNSSRNDTYTGRDENLFDGSLSRQGRLAPRDQQPRPNDPPKSKVMTADQFETYRRDKERQARLEKAKQPAEAVDEDDVDYDEMGEEDEAEKAKQQAKQRRKQQAHLAVYRQQMMKITGEPAMPSPPQSSRPSLGQSLSMPLMPAKTPSPDPSNGEEDEDEDVPLAILQAHGFPAKARTPSRLSVMGSNPNLRASMAPQPARPGSSMGASASGTNQRHSTMPAFARNLPQDPFLGASVSRPAIRESMSYGGGNPAPAHGSVPPGGLVGVIASEERSRAMRRGSPNMESQRGPMGGHASGMDPMAGMPPHMMYQQGGRQSMAGMPQMLTPGDQAQIHMTQQMQQFMQMQMQFMQMMTANGQGGPMPQMPGMPQHPYGGGMGSQSTADLSGRQSVMGDQMGADPYQLGPGMRTMSMVGPGISLQAPSIHGSGAGYSPSIAPSERSNVGLPGRYRPVSQAGAAAPGLHTRSSTMSGALSSWDDGKGSNSTIRVTAKSEDHSDDDEESGWEAMKAAREQKKAQRKTRKSIGGLLNAF